MNERTDVQELIEKYRRLCRSEKGKAFAVGIFGDAAVAFLIYGLAMLFSIISDIDLWSLSSTAEFFCIAAITIILLLISAACLVLISIPVALYQDVRNTITADEIAGFVESIDEDTFVEIQGPPLKFESMRTLDVDFFRREGDICRSVVDCGRERGRHTDVYLRRRRTHYSGFAEYRHPVEREGRRTMERYDGARQYTASVYRRVIVRYMGIRDSMQDEHGRDLQRVRRCLPCDCA